MKMKSYSNDISRSLEPQFSTREPDGWGRNVKLSYCEFMQKNKPQSNSISGGLLVLCAGGYHIAWLLWNLSKPQYDNATLFLQFACWYFGTILGSILGARLLTSWQKKSIYYLCGAISTVGGILFVVWYNIASVIAVGRLISGFGHGIAYVTTISHGAENVIKEMRGRLISSIQFLIYSSAFTFTIVMMYSSPSYPNGLKLEQMTGILAILFALMGLAFTPCLTYESITYLLYRNDERQALENMIKLRNESGDTWNVRNDLQEMKLMVAEDREKSRNITKDNNLRPLLLMSAITVITALSSNLILNTKLIKLIDKSFMSNWDSLDEVIDESSANVASINIAAVILVTFRYIAGLVMLLFGDFFTRKKCLRFSAGLSAVSLLIIHILSRYTLGYTNGVNWISGIFAIAFQIFVGVGVEPMQHVILSEAFSTAKKYWSIACIVTFESLIQISIIGLSFINADLFVNLFVYVSVLCIILMTLLLHMKLPETRGVSLRQARDEFTKTGRPEGITYS